MSSNPTEIKTSHPEWVTALAKCYKERTPVLLVDDAKLGIDPASQTIVQMGMRGDLGINEWVAVVVSLGVAAAGAYLLVMAIIDPEPFSKIAFALGSGTALLLGGGFTAVQILAKLKPPRVRVGPNGFEIAWE